MKERLNVPNLEGHLVKGVKPIVVCVGSFDDFKSEISMGQLENVKNNFGLGNLKDMNWMRGTYGLNSKEDYLTAGPGTYVISAIDDSNKSSNEFNSCTGLIVSGVDEKTGQNISFATHQLSSAYFLDSDFVEDFKKRLLEMKHRCKPGTIDTVIIGGEYPDVYDDLKEAYPKTIELLSKEIKEAFGFEPIVINGPKISNPQGVKADSFIFDNKNKRLYLLRPKMNPDTGSFSASDLDKEKDKWK